MITALGAVTLGVGAAAHVWARHVEIHQYRLREVSVPALPVGARPVRVLHLSDAHLLPDQHRKVAFLRRLAATEPDVVVDTGDNIASAAAIPVLAEAIEPLLHRPGVVVLGSNDLYAPSPKNPLRYFLPDPRPEGLLADLPAPTLPTDRLLARLCAHGWVDLNNRRAVTELPGLRIRWVGVDDPHLERDRMPTPDDAAVGSERPEIRIGVAHAPYRAVLDAFVADGADLILAGHTHGGQLRIPGIGALVTNCDLPRRQAKGLSTWRGVPLHVSGGLGASPYSNYRLANPPEATLLTLRPRG
ncbi:metallophosphoesterase [Brachybacterium sp. EF45031]|nr:metallophosphoesterase [Brachybacterium sillae]